MSESERTSLISVSSIILGSGISIIILKNERRIIIYIN